MDLQELLAFIDFEDNVLIDMGHSSSHKERILARTVKLTEELGELCNEVLSYLGEQRQEKLDRHNQASLESEFADVVITTLLLAKSMNVNIEEALVKKIAKIKKRQGMEE